MENQAATGLSLLDVQRIEGDGLWLRYIVPIPGTRKPERMRENAGAADITLTAAEARALDEALDGMEMSDVFGSAPPLPAA